MTTIIKDLEESVWDKYVKNHSAGSFSHLYGWAESIVSVYDLRVFRLASIDGNRVTGLLPLILFPAPKNDVRLISLPYTDAAGLIADDKTAAAALQSGALDLANTLHAAHLELRQANTSTITEPADKNCWSEACAHSFKTGLARVLPGSSDLLWADLGSKVRNQIRKAEKCGCQAKIGGLELFEDFYAVFSENMRDLGSPVHSCELLKKTVTNLAAHIFMVYLNGIPAAGAVVFANDATLFNPWASSLRRFRPQCPNMFLYWTMLAYGAQNNFARFDFGRSTPGAPTCRFKQQWGAQMEPLLWYVFSRQGAHWNPRDESLTSEEWKNMDLASSLRKGPSLRRWISL